MKEKNAAAVALGRIKSKKKAAKARENGRKSGGRPIKPLAEIHCKCGKPDVLEYSAHRSDCLLAQAIKRRLAAGKPLD